MDRRPPRVAVALSPHLVSSAVASFLALDGRLEPVLIDETAADLVVIELSDSPMQVLVHGRGDTTAEPYAGLEALAERLAVALSASAVR